MSRPDNNIIEELKILNSRYNEISSRDYSAELEQLDGSDVSEGSNALKNYVRRNKTVIEKAADRYAMKICAADHNGGGKPAGRKQIKKSSSFMELRQKYLEDSDTYQELEKVQTPSQLPEGMLEEFHEQYADRLRKSELDSIMWNAEYLLEEAARSFDLKKAAFAHMSEMSLLLRSRIDEYFLNLKQDSFVMRIHKTHSPGNCRRVRVQVNNDTFDDFVMSFLNRYGTLMESEVWEKAVSNIDSVDFISEYLMENDKTVKAIKELTTPLDQYGTFDRALADELCRQDAISEKLRVVIRKYGRDHIYSLLSSNEHYAWIVEKRYRTNSRKKVRLGLLDAIPETYPELFPLAREMDRHFVLHIGPTNSGKSYESIEQLKTAEKGVYLAPLRLLAYEKYEEFMEAGIPCSMITGEEQIISENARIQSSTIEILDFETEYDMAVIDEGQMLSDPQRGSGWTMAILGIRCPLVHICLAPEAEGVIKDIIDSCQDTYEVVRHERLVPLEYQKEQKDIFPKNAQRGDAFIVFSRRDVHACAAELQDLGIKCSMIYGNLPYDVRRREVKRYESGETDVIVATDAIGMGLNLPIRRIVFLRSDKYDGIEQRLLLPQEVKQIAGRAGRYKMFDKGIVSSDVDKKMIGEYLSLPVEPIDKAVIGFPYSLIKVRGNLSYLLNEWSLMKPLKGYEMADMAEEIQLATELEECSDDKDLIFRFVMIPFDVENDRIHKMWKELFLSARDEKYVSIYEYTPKEDSEDLHRLEEDFKVCDLLYHYARMFLNDGQDMDIMEIKSRISEKITEILKKEAPEHRACRYCGKKLPFNYKFSVCEKCYRRRRSM